MFGLPCLSNLSLFDGADDDSPLIGTYCSSQQRHQVQQSLMFTTTNYIIIDTNFKCSNLFLIESGIFTFSRRH